MNDKMSNNEKEMFLPDYVVTPGEVLIEYLEAAGMSQADLARRTGLSPVTISDIVKGKAPVSREAAVKLQQALDRPAHFWLNLEALYQEDKARLDQQEDIALEIKLPLAWGNLPAVTEFPSRHHATEAS